MKNPIYVKKLSFHNLFSGVIVKKLHIQIGKLAFRVPYARITPVTDKQSKYFGITN